MALFDGFTLPPTKPNVPSWMQEEVFGPSVEQPASSPAFVPPVSTPGTFDGFQLPPATAPPAFVPPTFSPGVFDGFQLPPTEQAYEPPITEHGDSGGYGGYPEPSEPMFQVKDPVGATQMAAAGRPYYTALALSEMMGGEKAGKGTTVDGFQIPLTERDINVTEAPPGFTRAISGSSAYYQPSANQIMLSTYPEPVDRSLPNLVRVRGDGAVLDPFLVNLMNTGLPYGSRTLAHEYAHHTDFGRDRSTREDYEKDLWDYRNQLLAQSLPYAQHFDLWGDTLPKLPGNYRSGSFDERLARFPGFTTDRWGGPVEFFGDSLPYLAQRGLGAVPAQLQKYYSPYIAPSFDPLVRNIPFSQTVNHPGAVPYFGY